MNWYNLQFTHRCGREGTILHINGNANGEVMMVGVCVPCGKKFAVTDTSAHIVAQCAVADNGNVITEQDLFKMKVKGKDN